MNFSAKARSLQSVTIMGSALLGMATATCTGEPVLDTQRIEESRCVAVLVSALELRSTFISIHAAEALITTGRGELARETFLAQSETQESRYRIGVWRVLARLAETDLVRNRYVDRIRSALIDPHAEDRVHAIESLAKLGTCLHANEVEIAKSLAAARETSGSPYAIWALINSGESEAIKQLTGLLEADNPVVQAQAAYSLWQMKQIGDHVRQRMSAVLVSEPVDSPARNMLIAAIGGEPVIQAGRAGATPAARYLAAMAIADSPELEVGDLLDDLLRDPDPDVRVAGAFAWLNRHARDQ